MSEPYWEPLGAVSAGVLCARVRRDINNKQTITSGIGTYIVFDTEDIDIGDFWVSGQPTRLTIPITGVYRLRARCAWDVSGTGTRELQILINRGITLAYQIVNASAAPGNSPHLEAHAMHSFLAGDYLEAYVVHSAGGNLDVNFGDNNFYCGFEIQKIS